jgi:hypothetical protein
MTVSPAIKPMSLFITFKVEEISSAFHIPLPSLCRLLIHRVRDPVHRALCIEDDRMERAILKPNTLPPLHQQGWQL